MINLQNKLAGAMSALEAAPGSVAWGNARGSRQGQRERTGIQAAARTEERKLASSSSFRTPSIVALQKRERNTKKKHWADCRADGSPSVKSHRLFLVQHTVLCMQKVPSVMGCLKLNQLAPLAQNCLHWQQLSRVSDSGFSQCSREAKDGS